MLDMQKSFKQYSGARLKITQKSSLFTILWLFYHTIPMKVNHKVKTDKRKPSK